MDYEQRYNDALARAKEYFKANQKIGELDENDVLSSIFPELKESEEKMMDWLEKKGEQQQELTPDYWQDLRAKAAIVVLPQGIEIAKELLCKGGTINEEVETLVASMCVRYADALVKKLKGE